MTATDGQHFADVMPIEINLVETEGFGGDTSLNGEMSSFKCKETGVAQRLAKILQQAEKNNRGKEEFPPTSSRYLANIHFPVFERIPQSFYVNETAPIGADVFQVSRVFHSSLPFPFLSSYQFPVKRCPSEGCPISIGVPADKCLAMPIPPFPEAASCYLSVRTSYLR